MAVTSISDPRGDAEIASVVPRGLPLGEVIPGTRYRAIAPIGKGGMGLVYEAEHLDLRKRVAIKVLSAKSARDTKRVAAFLREAQTASRMTSPYIADVNDYGELPDGRVFFVMQLVDGQSLGQRLRAGEVFTAARVVPILRQIAKGLGETHAKGVAHLDVKPDNVLLVRGAVRPDSVKMVDFGVAGLLEEAPSGAKAISGTPEYVSPERIQARPYDQRSDVYSLGVVAYELLTGVPPFQGKDSVAILKQHIEQEPASFAESAPGRNCPAAVENVVRQLLAKDPDDRPADMATAEALLLEAQIESGLTTAWDDLELPQVDARWRESLAERMPTPGARRRKILTATGVVLSLLGAALAVYAGVFRGPEIVVQQVRVEGRDVSEAAEVAAWIVRAQQAMRRQLYVLPVGDSVLDHIERAEEKARQLATRSVGAQILRESSAAALLAMGTELQQVDLPELALIKFREALRFLPGDPELKRLAELSPEDERLFADRQAWEAKRREDESQPARDRTLRVAADLFQAARKGQDSQARLLQRELAQLDRDGTQSANLADGLRKLATRSWGSGEIEQARSVYRVITRLDPEDRSAAVRAEDPRGPTEVVPPGETPIRALAVASPAPPSARAIASRQRDPGRATALVADGLRLIRAVELAEARASFERALAADGSSHAAYAGLAEVSFEEARYEDALSYARRAVALAPKLVAYKILLGDCCYKLFRYGQARDVWRTGQRLAPGDREIARRLADVEAKIR